MQLSEHVVHSLWKGEKYFGKSQVAADQWNFNLDKIMCYMVLQLKKCIKLIDIMQNQHRHSNCFQSVFSCVHQQVKFKPVP